jgi:hypothetical protein
LNNKERNPVVDKRNQNLTYFKVNGQRGTSLNFGAKKEETKYAGNSQGQILHKDDGMTKGMNMTAGPGGTKVTFGNYNQFMDHYVNKKQLDIASCREVS